MAPVCWNSSPTVCLAAGVNFRQCVKKELQKQRKLLEQQARSAKEQAKSEKDRLALERRRLDLEEKERAFDRDKKAQIKNIRKLMTVLSSDIDDIELKHL